jgi:Ni/Co efflux regulator RcnB
MRRVLLSTAILALLVLPAMAQPESRRIGKASVAPEVQDRAQAEPRRQARPQGGSRSDNGRGERTPAAQNTIQSAAPTNRDNRGEGRGRGDGGAAPTTQATIQSPEPSNRGDRASSSRGNWQGRGDRTDRGYRQGGDNANGRDFNRDGRTGYRPNGRAGAGYGGPRHDFSGFRDYHRNFNASHRFNVPYYRRPAGWYDHRWGFGEFLPAAFWARDYWLDDFQTYDLPPPPYGAVWVRVGNDALLVDEDSGEIISVAYSVFY